MQRLSIRLKGCPRCRGDLFPEYDLGGADLVCLQCGYVQPVFVLERDVDEARSIGAVATATDSSSELAA